MDSDCNLNAKQQKTEVWKRVAATVKKQSHRYSVDSELKGSVC